jgi:hypothetical protein
MAPKGRLAYAGTLSCFSTTGFRPVNDNSDSTGMSWRELRDVSFVTKIENVLDRHYSEAFSFPARPVNFVAGVKLAF